MSRPTQEVTRRAAQTSEPTQMPTRRRLQIDSGISQWTFPSDRRARAPRPSRDRSHPTAAGPSRSPSSRAHSPQRPTISTHEILGPGSTEERTSLAGVLATAMVAGQTQTYDLSLTLGAYPRRTLADRATPPASQSRRSQQKRRPFLGCGAAHGPKPALHESSSATIRRTRIMDRPGRPQPVLSGAGIGGEVQTRQPGGRVERNRRISQQQAAAG